jgi:hypothetical protein
MRVDSNTTRLQVSAVLQLSCSSIRLEHAGGQQHHPHCRCFAAVLQPYKARACGWTATPPALQVCCSCVAAVLQLYKARACGWTATPPAATKRGGGTGGGNEVRLATERAGLGASNAVVTQVTSSNAGHQRKRGPPCYRACWFRRK